MFVSAEIVLSHTMYAAEEADYIILDFRRIASLHEGAMNLIARLVESLGSNGKKLLFTSLKDELALVNTIKRRVPNIQSSPLLKHNDLDKALEWCENQLLSEHISTENIKSTLAGQAICEYLSSEELEYLHSFLKPAEYKKGEYICHSGEAADDFFFILSGQVSVLVPVGFRRGSRITILTGGSVFGEMGLLDHGKRSADVVADTDIQCLKLRYVSLETDQTEMGRDIRFKLIANIGRQLTYKLRQATNEIKSLKS